MCNENGEERRREEDRRLLGGALRGETRQKLSGGQLFEGTLETQADPQHWDQPAHHTQNTRDQDGGDRLVLSDHTQYSVSAGSFVFSPAFPLSH